MKALKSSPRHEALVIRQEVSFQQAMKAIGKIMLQLSGCVQYCHPEEILYFKSDSNYTEIHFQNGTKVLIPKTLKDIESDMPTHVFFRVHRSFLVNIQHITHFYCSTDGSQIRLSNNDILPVSRDKKSIFFL